MDILASRKWLTLKETSRFLSKKLKDEIRLSDVARLIADGVIRPSVFFHTPVFVRAVDITDRPLSYVLSETETALSDNRKLLSQEPILPNTLVPHATPIDNQIMRVSSLWSALPTGIAKHEAERIYSQEEQLPMPTRSLYDIKGIVIAEPTKKYQLITGFDVEKELLELIKLSQSQDSEGSGFLSGHIEKLKNIRDEVRHGKMENSFIPCTSLPQNAYFAIKMEDIESFFCESREPQKKISLKTQNAQAQFIYGLLFTKYGKDVADNPRPHIENPRGVIRTDFDSLNLSLPSGNAVSGWLKNIDS